MPSDDIMARFRAAAGADASNLGGVDVETDGRCLYMGRYARFMRHALGFLAIAALLVLVGIGVAVVRFAWHSYSLAPALVVTAAVARWLWRVLNEFPPRFMSRRMYDMALDADTRSITIRRGICEADPPLRTEDIEYLVYCKLLASAHPSHTGIFAVTTDRASCQLIKGSISDAKRFLRVLGHTCDRPAIVLDTFEAAREHRDSPYWSLTRDRVDVTDKDALLRWGEVVYSPGEPSKEPAAEEMGI